MSHVWKWRLFFIIIELVLLSWSDEWEESEVGDFRNAITGKMLSFPSLLFLLGRV